MVSDNASTDGTGELVKTYLGKHSANIQYFRNDSNVGFDRNVDLLFKRSSGKFVWTMGDDDLLSEGALLSVLNLLEQNPNLKVVQVNFDKYDPTLERIVDKCEIPSDLLCHDPNTFLLHAHGRYGALSAVIIDRAAWNNEDLSNAFGSLVIHMYGLVQVLLRGDSFIVHEPLVKVRDGSKHAVKPGDGDGLLNVALTSGLLYHSMKRMGYSPEIVDWYLKTDRRYLFNAIPRAKFWGIQEKLEISKKLIAVHNTPELWIRWLPVVLCPDLLFKFLYSLKKSISAKTRPIERKLKAWLMKKPS